MSSLSDRLTDFKYSFQGWVLMFGYPEPPDNYLHSADSKKSPVILLGGIGSKWGFMKSIGDQISKAGHPVYVVNELGFNLQGLQESADILEKFILERKLKEIIIVGHSKGGLIAKYFMVHSKYGKKVKLLIAIATPFAGSLVAKKIPYAHYLEVAPSSVQIQKMQKNSAVNKRIVNITAEMDMHVGQNRDLAGAENICLPVKGHSRVVFDKETINLILKKIKK